LERRAEVPKVTVQPALESVLEQAA
jgi:hypothetical protein